MLRAPRPVPLHHRAITAQMIKGFYPSLDERRGSGQHLCSRSVNSRSVDVAMLLAPCHQDALDASLFANIPTHSALISYLSTGFMHFSLSLFGGGSKMLNLDSIVQQNPNIFAAE